MRRFEPFALDLHCLQRYLYWSVGMKGLKHLIKWIAASEKVPPDMRKIYRFRLSCACAKYHSDLCSPFIHSVVFNDSVSRQRRSWSDCADAQADLALAVRICPETCFGMERPNKIVFLFKSGIAKHPFSFYKTKMYLICVAAIVKMTAKWHLSWHWSRNCCSWIVHQVRNLLLLRPI